MVGSISLARVSDSFSGIQLVSYFYCMVTLVNLQAHMDADNRLVADAREADWNKKLREQLETEREYERPNAEDQKTMDEEKEEKGYGFVAQLSSPVERNPITPIATANAWRA